MTKHVSTKRALILSLLSMLLCVSMLVGSTYAWFTDTATTSVNKIQAGTLDVALEMKDGDNWVSAEGKILNFKTADNRTKILWEPGCTYSLPELRVVNKGNLALKYKIMITGIKGSAKLNEAIEWTISDAALESDHSLAAGAASEPLTIKGHMKDDAGNEYQGLSINGISITVYATQDTVEKDSNGNQYDKDAAYKGSQEFTSGTHTLNKGGVALNPSDVAVLVSGAGTNVTIEGGYYDGGKGGDNRCIQVDTGASVTIKDGTFTVGGDANDLGNSVVLCNGGDVTIEGGFFYTEYQYRGFYYVLNQQNGNPGTITVTGGTFVNYDPSKGDDHLGGNFVADGYTVVKETKANGDEWYTVVKGGNTLEEAFTGVDFGYGSESTEAVNIDGEGVTTVYNWTDAWVNSNTTIKGVTFKNGAVFTAKADNVTVTLENCTFYACDQSKLTYTGNNSLTNSGAGMCLNLEKSSHTGVKFIVRNCTFIGENDSTLSAEGPRYNGEGTVNGMKKRGHAIAVDAICGGGTGTLDSLLIEGCVINGVRGNAIQLYGKTGDITIKDTQINSWAVNNTGIGYAIRGDFDANGSRTLTISNVYFGLDEISGNTEFGHIKVGSFSGNTDGTRVAGTY